MPFLVEPQPFDRAVKFVAPGVRRRVAHNPSPMTYFGTNTYLIEHDDGVIVLDPGPPNDQLHIDTIMRAADGRIAAIVLSHGHIDHAGALAALRDACGAPVYAFHQSIMPGLVADFPLMEGDVVGPLQALHTPGHASDHLCFARADGLVFTADHVMGWSSSVVSPPGGSMRDYLASLERLIARQDTLYLPGHGPAIVNPRPYVQDLRDRRLQREDDILRSVRQQPMTTGSLSSALYAKHDPVLQAAAERNVLAHLLKLQSDGNVFAADGVWTALV